TGWTKKVLAEFTENNNLVALSGPYVYYDLSWLVNLEVKIFYLIAYSTYIFDRYLLGKGGMLQGGNFVIRRSVLQQINGFNTQISFYGEDTEIARRLQKVGRVKFTFFLPMFSSGRRLSKEGVLVSGAKYGINYLWILLFKKPFSKTSTDIRYN
ncbi:MAG: glycosyltransferase family 2 protein, partial [Patescibacteria group bacterium]